MHTPELDDLCVNIIRFLSAVTGGVEASTGVLGQRQEGGI